MKRLPSLLLDLLDLLLALALDPLDFLALALDPLDFLALDPLDFLDLLEGRRSFPRL